MTFREETGSETGEIHHLRHGALKIFSFILILF